MKKNKPFGELFYRSLKKTLLTMRIAVILMILGILQARANDAYSQKTRLSLNFSETELVKVLDKIEDESEFFFLYNEKLLDTERKVTLDEKNQLISVILDELFKSTDVNYTIIDRKIILAPDYLSESPQQPQKRITGTVTDKNGAPVPGANVVVTGTTQGTLTDAAGKYSVEVPQGARSLTFSFIGMQPQEISIGTLTQINVTMAESAIGLDEVVVIGYGTQKKINLTGAIDQIGEESFQNRPIANISQALQGSLSNLNIDFADGKPIRSPSYNIRGMTSIGQGGSALILIDGVEGDPSFLNPNDIESVSILKDASSAAVYGARGAFGVVLITTKSPEKEQFSATYSSSYSLKKLTEYPDYVTDGYQWASMFSDAYSAWNDYIAIAQNVNKSMKFSLNYLSELERRSKDPSLSKVEIDPSTGEYIYYSNTNWYDELYKKNSFAQDQNLTLSGGSERTTFYLTGRYVNQQGIFKYNSDDYKMYNFRAKGSLQLAPWLNIQNNTSYSNMLYHNPIGANEIIVWRGVMYDEPPMAPVYNPDGTLTISAARGVGSYIYGKNREDTDRNSFNNMTSFISNIYEDKLSLKGDFTIQISNSNLQRIRVPVPYSSYEGQIDYVDAATNNILETASKTTYLTSNLYTEYENTINDHYVKAMVGTNYELSTTKSMSVFRNGLIYEDAENINLALGQSYTLGGGWDQWNIVGGFYRLNYTFKNRYLIEANGRYDGSSKFPSNERYAFFPSLSVGWRPSQESFWPIPEKLISDLKFRFSYGSLGNGNINSYTYVEKFNIYTGGRILDEGNQVLYTRNSAILPDGLTWETSTTTNLGFDLSMVDNHLNITGDVYTRKTTDMFTVGLTLPAVFGASSPYGNYADLETKGWELSLSWDNQFSLLAKPLSFNARFILSDYTAKILKYNNIDKRLTDYYEGQVLGEIWGFETAGFFESQEEVENWPDQTLYKSSATGSSLPGDIKFADLNNDGVINIGKNTANDPGDRKIIGNSNPRYRFGLNLSADWNNFFFSSFFQGVGKQDWYPDPNCASFWGQYVAQYANPPTYQLGNIWTEDNPDAYFPRYRAYIALSTSRTLGAVQTKYLQNVAYIRLKNIQLGYNLPKNFVSKIKANKVQVYFSGENIWTYSPLYKLIGHHVDVENIKASDIDLGSGSQGGGFSYPVLESYTFGLEVTF